MTRDEMDRLTEHTAVKAERIRILNRAGSSRSEIAAYLGISYQHVHNVLKRCGLLADATSEAAEQPTEAPAFVSLTLGRNNTIALPNDLVSRAGLSEGDDLVGTFELGRITILTRENAANLIMEAALRHMPGQADLLGTLLGREKPPRSS